MRRVLTAIALAALAAPVTGHTADGPYKVLKTVKTGGDGSWDYVYADPMGRKLYAPRLGQTGHIMVFGGGGGTITPDEITELQDYGVERIYHPNDGMALGLTGMIDDLVQRTFVAAIEHPPATDRPLRPWLAAVLRNRRRMDLRAGERRRRRESVIADVAATSERADADDAIVRARVLENSGVRLEWEIKRIGKLGESGEVLPFLGQG